VANIERSNLAECDPATYADKFHMIDHHYGNNRTVGKHFLFEDIKSCCEIIAVILMDTYPQHIDEDIATLLLMGILTDSGGFTWS
jgi:nanoRNase/pAp phosphatase (c-di-AMP/oligoRNAs hydrolase)